MTVGKNDRHLADSSRSDLTSNRHATEGHAPLRLTGKPVEGSLSDTPLGDLAPVGGHGEDVGQDEDAEAPGKSDPDVAADRLLGEQVLDRVDDRRDRLVLGEGPHGTRHGVRWDEGRADERQEDQRVGESGGTLHGLRREAGDDGDPGECQGEERQDSVYNGLLALSYDTDIVVVHDGARPLFSSETLASVIAAAQIHGAAACAVPAKDTVKLADDEGFVASTLPRGRIWLVQTPQAFRYELIIEAHRRAREENIFATDDTALVESIGGPVKLVMGSYENIKITTPEDLDVARAIINASSR